MAAQVKVDAGLLAECDWAGRSIGYHRAQIRRACGFRESRVADEADWVRWLSREVCPVEFDHDRRRAAVVARCGAERIEPPAASRKERVLGAAQAAVDRHFTSATFRRPLPGSVAALEGLVAAAAGDRGCGLLAELRSDPGQPGLDTILAEIAELDRIRALGLPEDLFADVPGALVEIWRARAARMFPSDLRASPAPTRITLLAALCRARGRDIPDHVLAHISPAHSENINFFGTITVDVEAELAKLDPNGRRPLRSR